MFQCIGQKAVQNHKGEKAILIRCNATSETPTRADKPAWGFLCGACANAAPSGGYLTLEEAEPINVGAMQVDPEEYRDQVESFYDSGFLVP